ncbi:hypothetical protein ACWFRB_09405 [Rhodococcus sp. NPDC055112]
MPSLKPEGISDRERALGAMRDRRDGMQWAEVAEAWGYHDKSTAHRAVKGVLDRVEGETVDDYREVVNARYEALYAKAWEAIEAAEAKGQLVGKSQLVAAARGVLDSQAKLLGLAAPQKSELTVHTRSAIDDEIEKLTEALRSGVPAPQPQEAGGQLT